MIMCGITDFTKDGACSRCGSCCTSLLPATDAELHAMKAYADAHDVIPMLPAGKKYADMAYMRCPFLHKKDGGECECLVHPARPAICRTFLCSQDEGGAVRALMAFGVDPAALELRNLWNLYGMTGIRIHGVDVVSGNAAVAKATLDDGTERTYIQGRPVDPVLKSGQALGPGLLVELRPESFVFAGAMHGMIEIKYEDVKEM